MALLDLVLNRTPGGGLAQAATGRRISKGVSFVGRTQGQTWKWEGEDDSVSAVAYRCVMAIAGNASSLDLEVLRNEEVVEGHPVSAFFNNVPNPLMSARVLKEVVFARLEWKGQAFVYLDRGENGTGPIAGVWPIYGTVKPVIDRDAAGEDALMGYQVDVGQGRKVGLLPSEVLWLRYPDPEDAWGCLAPWRAAKFAHDLDRAIQKWQADEVKHGGRTQSLVYLGDLTEDQHDAAVAEFNASVQTGHKRHMLVSGPAPAGVQKLGATAEELAYLDSRRMNLEEVCLAFGVPKDVLLGGSTYENQRAAKTFLWSDTIVMKLETVASEVERQMLETGESAAFDVSEVEALQENADALAARTNGQLLHDLITLDEGRTRFGLEPLPNGLGELTLTAYRRAVFGGTGVAPDTARLTGAVSGRRFLVGARGPRWIAGPVSERAALPVAPTVAVRGVAMTPEEVQARYDVHEARGEKAAAKLFRRQERAVLNALRRLMQAERKRLRLDPAVELSAAVLEARINAEGVFDVAHWTDETRDAYEHWLAAVWDDGGQRMARHLGLSFSTFDPRVAVAMAARLDTLATQVTETTRRILEEDILGPGVAAGASVDDLAASIKERFAGMATHRAVTIARTETVGGFNAASRVAALESGVVVRREWIAASDSRVRDSHEQLNGYRTTGLEDHYPNGLMFPGDPSGPPAETVRCRCVETWETEA